ncbi:MAG: hypothetical protein LBJ11_02635 [Oscillospiraceae bacterium]|jgi:hypothetical protein|nr:hypothetical protein [Oscillospiraceae bacterium]
MSLATELTMAWKDPPITTPMARLTALPLETNALNSFQNPRFVLVTMRSVCLTLRLESALMTVPPFALACFYDPVFYFTRFAGILQVNSSKLRKTV